ncbi:hypothetical protein Vafri_12651 [Volvox africanus]|uniref:SRCR domain-containing protein n=1 Tax=Volvox africanus TaxID=51714 RepID=A0A8J4F1T0_9CHLO|nr:hypothetical protein Vafri_12651 [Volvox africanus]
MRYVMKPSFRLLSFIIAALTLQYSGGRAAPVTSEYTYTKNGVRLIGGNKSVGRVEVLSEQQQQWFQVCDAGFRDDLALVLCKMLGYKYGRKYFAPDIVFPKNFTERIASTLICEAVLGGGGRRLIQERSTNLRVGDDSQSVRRGRDLRSLNWDRIDSPASAPYDCQFRAFVCNPAGPVTGLQCSSTSLPPAPSPPPQPPNPPPAPPSIASMIRIFVTDNDMPVTSDGFVEPNLCANPKSANLCDKYFGRAEIQINNTDPKVPTKIWAPVCGITKFSLASEVANVACEQRYQIQYLPWIGDAYYISSLASRVPFYIPTQAVSPGDFNPAAVKAYVTITGKKSDNPTKLQDFKYTVSKNGCNSRALLAFRCILVTNDAAFP